MTVWEVSEPYINLWLYDEPLGYQPGLGPRISFKLSYKQRDARFLYTGVSGNYTGMGPQWNCSWVSYLYRNFTITTNGDGTFTTNYDGTATVVMGDGGQRTFTADGATIEYYSHGTLTNAVNPDGSWNTAGITYPDNSTEVYSQVTPTPLRVAATEILYLTARYDRFGNPTHFYYESSSPLLQYVVDADGRTNTLFYTGDLVTSVRDPFGRTASLQYDSFGILTNITDVALLNSSFMYDTNGWVTNLHTPYGTTTFEHFDYGFGTSNQIIRGCRVVDAAGGVNVYVLTQTNNYSLPGFQGWPNLVEDPNPITIEEGYTTNRDSFHWGPRQAAGLPLDLTTLQNSDFLKGHMKHWLYDTKNYTPGLFDYTHVSGAALSETLSFEVEPSADDQNIGLMTLYDYAGKSVSNYVGTESSPSLVTRVLPDGTTWFTAYQRDALGRPTSVIDTYSTGYGQTPQLRTNVYVYNGADLISHYGPNGNLEDGYSYNANHQVIAYTNAVGDVTSYTYDSARRLTSTLTPAGLTTTNIYFASGPNTNLLQQAIDLEISRTNSYTWANDLMATHTDERGLTTTILYDPLQRATNVLDARGTITYTYSNLDLVQVVDRLGFPTSFAYDNVRRMKSKTDALNRTTYYNYCTCGALDSIQDAAGNYTRFFYDYAGRMTNVVYPDLYSVTNILDSLGELFSTVDSAGIAVTNWFNNQGLRYTTWNAKGQVSLLQFDIKDRPIYVTDANGVSITNTYDPLGRLVARLYPDGGVEQYGYSPRGLIAYTNQLNYTNFYAYDPALRKTFETNANGEILRYANDAAEDLLSLTDGKNQKTQWNYDQFGRVTNKLDQAGSVIFIYSYDADDRPTNRWTPAKSNTGYTYDSVGNLTFIQYPSSPSVTLQYDALDRLTNMVDAAGTTRYNYTAAGQLLTETGPFASDTVSNIYSSRLRMGLNLQQPTGAWTNAFSYDLAGRLAGVTSPAGAFAYQYPAGLPSTLVQKLSLPNTSYITNTYDGNARLLGTYLKTSGNTVLDSAAYIYNVGNQRTSFVNAAGTSVAYTYDRIGQLKVGNSTISAENRGYAYDAAWNLNFLTNSDGTKSQFSVNNLNELTSGPGGNCIYDANGNLIYAALGANGTLIRFLNGEYCYCYDDENRLTTWRYAALGNSPACGSNPGTNSDLESQFVYDGLGRLRERIDYTTGCGGGDWCWQATNTVLYIYDGMRVIQERNGNNTPTVNFTRGSDLSGTMEGAGGIGGLLARSTGVNYYYHADGNGNIMCLESTAQTLLESCRYDLFGNLVSGSFHEFGFSSKEWFGNGGLYYHGYRWYSPALQRWLNRDPIQEYGGINLYGFAENSPVNRIDPFGLTPPYPPPPPNVPGGPWSWSPDPNNSRGGTFTDPSGKSASWDCEGSHWDVNQGNGQRSRYSRWGKELTKDEAHAYRGPRQSPRGSPLIVIGTIAATVALDAAQHKVEAEMADAQQEQASLNHLLNNNIGINLHHYAPR